MGNGSGLSNITVLASTQTLTGANTFTGSVTVSSFTVVSETVNGTIYGSPALFGTWLDKTASYGPQQATNDGFIAAYGTVGATAGSIYIYTDSSSPPT